MIHFMGFRFSVCKREPGFFVLTQKITSVASRLNGSVKTVIIVKDLTLTIVLIILTTISSVFTDATNFCPFSYSGLD